MNALDFLRSLVDQPLSYGIKSRDIDLYDLGFGSVVSVVNPMGGKIDVCPYILHVTCRFKVIWKNGKQRVDRYYEDTPFEMFHSEIKRIIGMKVIRVSLSDKNDLWLDFGDCWMVFATFESGEESWRFFTSNTESPHLVASDSWLYFTN